MDSKTLSIHENYTAQGDTCHKRLEALVTEMCSCNCLVCKMCTVNVCAPEKIGVVIRRE